MAVAIGAGGVGGAGAAVVGVVGALVGGVGVGADFQAGVVADVGTHGRERGHSGAPPAPRP